jgi:hypothetical protein
MASRTEILNCATDYHGEIANVDVLICSCFQMKSIGLNIEATHEKTHSYQCRVSEEFDISGVMCKESEQR